MVVALCYLSRSLCKASLSLRESTSLLNVVLLANLHSVHTTPLSGSLIKPCKELALKLILGEHQWWLAVRQMLSQYSKAFSPSLQAVTTHHIVHMSSWIFSRRILWQTVSKALQKLKKASYTYCLVVFCSVSWCTMIFVVL